MLSCKQDGGSTVNQITADTQNNNDNNDNNDSTCKIIAKGANLGSACMRVGSGGRVESSCKPTSTVAVSNSSDVLTEYPELDCCRCPLRTL